MFSSIRFKFLSVLLGIAVVAVGLATWQHTKSSIDARQQELTTSAVSLGQLVGIKVVGSLLKRKKSLPITQRKELTGWVNTTEDVDFLAVYNPSGTNIFAYRQDGKSLPESKNLRSSLIEDLLNSDKKFIGRDLPQQKNYDLLIPLRLFGSQIGVVRLGMDVSHFYSERRNIIYTNAFFGFVLVLVTGVFGYGLTSYVVNPINQLTSTAAQFGEGNLEIRAKIKSGDEIQELGEQFNTMAKKIQRQIEDLRTIEQINREISAQLRPETLHDQIVNIVHETWDIPYVALFLEEDEDQSLTIASGLNVNEDLDPGSIDESLNEISSNETNDVQPNQSPFNEVFDLDSKDSLRDTKILRLSSNGNPLGYLILAQTDSRFSTSENNLFPMLTHQISIALQNARNYVRAVTDDLTGLYTRRFFNLELTKKIESEENHPLSLAMIDVDDFKHYNDTYGHPAGDEVLKVLADTFESHVRTSDVKDATRQSDTVARYGGEEFAIILPATDLQGAKKVSQRIVDAVAAIEEFEEQVTISLGVAKYRVGESKETFITRSDDALYRAKDRGKNQVCVAGE